MKTLAFTLATSAIFLVGCSPKRYALRAVADAVSESGNSYASDEDPELVRDAVPFGLKTMESLAEAEPEHVGLLTALARGFTQFSYAYVQQEADAAELAGKSTHAGVLKTRARKLYLRAKEYGLRGLASKRERLAKLGSLSTKAEIHAALAQAQREDVPLLFWTGASLALAISNAKNDMALVGQLPLVEALMTRALELDEAWDEGAIHEFFVSYDASRSKEAGGGVENAKKHMEKARLLANNKKLGPLVSYAEAVCVQTQNKTEFKHLLNEVLKADPNADKRYRLANIIAQRRALMLLNNQDDLFL